MRCCVSSVLLCACAPAGLPPGPLLWCSAPPAGKFPWLAARCRHHSSLLHLLSRLTMLARERLPKLPNADLESATLPCSAAAVHDGHVFQHGRCGKHGRHPAIHNWKHRARLLQALVSGACQGLGEGAPSPERCSSQGALHAEASQADDEGTLHAEASLADDERVQRPLRRSGVAAPPAPPLHHHCMLRHASCHILTLYHVPLSLPPLQGSVHAQLLCARLHGVLPGAGGSAAFWVAAADMLLPPPLPGWPLTDRPLFACWLIASKPSSFDE